MKKLTAIILCLALVLSLAACGGSPATPITGGDKATEGGKDNAPAATTGDNKPAETRSRLTIAMGTDPGDLGPYGNNSVECFFIRQNIYETLYTFDDATGEMVGLLAENWDVDDSGLAYTFHLRETAVDSEGNPFTASDALFSLKSAGAEGAVTAIFTSVINFDETEVIDDHTIKIVYTKPGVSALAMVSKILMVTEAAFTSSPDHMVTTPVGTGPYKLADLVQSSSVTLVPNENYDGTIGDVKEIVFKIIAEDSQRTTALVTGDVDYIYDCPINDIDYINGNEGLTATETPSTTSVGFYFDCSEGSPMENLDLRKAICLALNNEAISKTVFGGHSAAAVASESTACPDVKEDFRNSETYAYNLELAKEYLDKSGYDVSQPLVLVCKTPYDIDQIAQVMQSMLSQLGLTVQIESYEASVYADLILKEPEKWDIVLSEWLTLTGLGLDSLEMAIGRRNYPHIDDASKAEIAELCGVAMNDPDPAKRDEACAKVFQMVHDNAWMYAICYPNNKCANADYVQNLHYYGFNNLSIKDVVLN